MGDECKARGKKSSEDLRDTESPTYGYSQLPLINMGDECEVRKKESTEQITDAQSSTYQNSQLPLINVGNECEVNRKPSTEQLNDVQHSINQNSPLSVVEIVNEKCQHLSEGDSFPKPRVPVSLPNSEIVGAQKDESEPGRSYAYVDQGGYGQTPYYQQQVAGQPVYVQGSPQPVDASRMPGYRPGNDDYNYLRDPSIFSESFDEVAIRNRFVQRVYTILTVQLIYTCGFIALCIFEPKIKRFVATNSLLLILSAVVAMVLMIAISCCISVRRNFPCNFIILAVFTMAFAYMMAVVSAQYSTFIVVTSMGITAGVCLLVSIFACQTSCDVTSWGNYLCLIGVVVLIFGLIAVVVLMITGSTIMYLIYAGMIALLFSLYLMFDTQMIMGGRRVELSPEEYIFGALTLYVDIMEIFWAILTILGMSRG